ncbi:SpoIID/LytB domain-containing protein [Bacillus atrophaeus]|uniref:SpoIID/LytB domain-containing protein n=1 Tax=Bacillus atrophaeus TaxID=1452 RepID=UPI002282AEF5|nr:SpoIID/LytB domain-containing protein [Bacillus atrophaeus]MCY7945882.1 SpoIID/LytB domain-containing protein [Bacillus atrophaeus]MCY8097501.1 SpoIID/LytB domain-containing protein [Bacillus atrophaeus]MCY9169270.1 SpoIID/LytB domain-containing protein [Bacillus atrophaeus]MEC0740119.1 SpoIID/LytB domain-containing protein [Bacillus atrophaeus]MEC0746215.1 SpoIID/LytB domain-containing protein [Bacillus atrophaeus]
MKSCKQLICCSLAVLLLCIPAVSFAADSEISVKLTNYIGNKSSITLSPTGSYKVTGDNVSVTDRFAGASRYETATLAASSQWSNPNTVIIINRDVFIDALPVIPLAKKLDAPVLFTQPDTLTKTTEKQLAKFAPDNILVIGGAKSISKDVENKLKNYGAVKRISGKNRYVLSQNIAKQMGNYDKAIVVTGNVFQDALAIAPYAAANGYPILLTEKDKLPDYDLPKQVLIIGSSFSVSDNVENQIKKTSTVQRIPGSTRYELTANIIKELKLKADKVVMTNGTKYADVLVGASLAAKKNSQILYIKQDAVPAAAKTITKEKATYAYDFIGSTSSISANVENTLADEFYLADGTNYNLNISNGKLNLENIKTYGNSLRIKPETYSTSNRISLNGKEYLGTVNFSIESSKYIRPVNENIPFEDYLKGVVPNEMPASWSLEALKAQSVAARTYSITKAGSTVADTTAFQVYGGYSWNANSTKAVEQTKGKVLKYNGSLITAAYSSSNGGYTEASNEVWASSVPYLIAKKDTKDPQSTWTLTLSKKQLDTNSLDLNKPASWWSSTNETNSAQLAGIKNWIMKNKETSAASLKIKSIEDLSFSGTTQGQRAKTASLKVNYIVKNSTGSYDSNKSTTITVPVTELRTMIGASAFKSTYVTVKKDTSKYTISGKGYGHGIGMSQYGAKARAESGDSYSTILKFYYPGTTLTNY